MNPRHRRSPKNLTLNQALPDWDEGAGIFSKLDAGNPTTPWHNYVSAAGLDIAYQGMRSGDKFVTNIFYKYLDDDGELTTSGASKIISAIQARFYQKWKHLWDDYVLEYSPLNSYNMTEEYEKSSTRTPNLSVREHGDDDTTYENDTSSSLLHGHTITDSGTDTTTDTHGHIITDSGTDTTTDTHGHVITDAGQPSSTTTTQVKGFNAVAFEDKQKDTTENVTDNTQTHSGSDTSTLQHGMVETHSGSDTSALLHGKVETNAGTDTTTGSEDSSTQRDIDITTQTTGTDKNDEEFSSTKQGTMYRAPAELLKLDRDFWLDDYFSIVFADLDTLLTLAVYSENEVSRTVF